MKPALLFERRTDFARFMASHLADRLEATLTATEDDPMVFEVRFRDGKEDEKAIIGLHNAYETYRRTGDLNEAIDFMDGIMESSRYVRGMDLDRIFDPNRIFPALRPRHEIMAMVKSGFNLLHYSEFPGLETVLIERKVGFTLLLHEEMLASRPQWDKQSIKDRAYGNLRKKGWKKPNLVLQSPFCEESEVHVYLDPPVPIQCQLLMPAMTARHLPESYIAAFPNKDTTMLLTGKDEMSTLAAARKFAGKTQLSSLVERSYSVQPYPLAKELYWIHGGKPVRM